MQIQVSTLSDIDEIFRLYRLATEFMRSKKTVVVWPEFDREMVKKEIEEKRQWKIVVNGDVACVWAVTFEDPEIWGEKNADPAIYIHRIATNPLYRNQNFVMTITDWARQYALSIGKEYVRLDTMGNNERLIKLYKDAGFDFLGFFQLKNTTGLPDHYQSGEPACLFEIDISKSRTSQA